MPDYLKLKKSNCQNCYKCIRHCPVKSIRFQSSQAHIVKDECILCGQCFVVCPQNAKEIRNDVPIAEMFVKGECPVAVSFAPSFVANYPGATIETMRAALKKLGFDRVEETAVGASVVKTEYEKIIKERRQSVIISTCCHSVNTLVQKYYPEALPYLAHVLSPMQAHCKMLKEEDPELKTVFIGPCISKKAEADESPYVDCVLTFEELSAWFEKEGITVEAGEDHTEESRARLFPTTGGILRTMACDDPEYTYMAIDGVENCINALEDIKSGKMENCFVEMSACFGSCINGPAMDQGQRQPVQDFIAVNKYAGKKDFAVPQPASEELKHDFDYISLYHLMPGNIEIEAILKKMGKTRPEQELNCGACGYNTCREKAIAVYQGKAEISMCLPYLLGKAQSFSDTIINNTPNGILVLNESLEIQQINAAARKIVNVKHTSEVLGKQVIRILDPRVFIDVMQSGRGVRDERVYLAEYGKYVDQTVLYDRNYHIIMCIMRDVTDEMNEHLKKEKMGQQTIEVTNRVIEKQMRVVQEIASLLGETTAETKIALTKLKESLQDE